MKRKIKRLPDNAAKFHWYIVDNEGNKITGGQQIYNTYRILTKQDLIAF